MNKQIFKEEKEYPCFYYEKRDVIEDDDEIMFSSPLGEVEKLKIPEIFAVLSIMKIKDERYIFGSRLYEKVNIEIPQDIIKINLLKKYLQDANGYCLSTVEELQNIILLKIDDMNIDDNYKQMGDELLLCEDKMISCFHVYNVSLDWVKNLFLEG